MRYFKKIVGEEVYLSPINADDAEKYCEWINDIDVAKYLDTIVRNINEEVETEFLKKAQKSGETFAIIKKDADRVVGICGLHNVNHLHRRADLGIFIGEKNYWNRGHGTEAVKLLLDFGFNILNLHNIRLSVIDYNKRAIKAYEKAGFKVIGARRESHLIAGNAYSLIYMDILASEFTSPYVKPMIEDQNREKDFGKRLEIV